MKDLAVKYKQARLKKKIMEDRMKAEIAQIREHYAPKIVEHDEEIAEMEGELAKWDWEGSASWPFIHDGKGFTIKRRVTHRTIVDDSLALLEIKDFLDTEGLDDSHKELLNKCIKESVVKNHLKKLINKGFIFTGAHIEENESFSVMDGGE